MPIMPEHLYTLESFRNNTITYYHTPNTLKRKEITNQVKKQRSRGYIYKSRFYNHFKIGHQDTIVMSTDKQTIIIKVPATAWL